MGMANGSNGGSDFLAANWRWLISTVGVPTLLLGYLLWQGIPFLGQCIQNNTAALQALQAASMSQSQSLAALLLRLNTESELADKRQREILANEQVIYDTILQKQNKLVKRLPNE